MALTLSSAPAKIAMVSAQANPLAVTGGKDADGQSVQVAGLCAVLAQRGHQVTVYSRRDHPGLPETVETPQGYRVVHVAAGPPEHLTEDELLRAMGPFAQCLDATWSVEKPDLVHAHFWVSGIAAVLVAQHFNLPSVLQFHGLGIEGTRIRLESKLAKAATSVSAACTEEAFELIRMGRPRQGTAVIPCGVDADVFNPSGPRAARNGQHRIVSVGKLVHGNGFDAVIRALPYISDAEFVIAGASADCDMQSDGEANRLRDLAEKLGVANRLRVYEAATVETPALLRSADVVACTPSYESSGVVALDAMACGVPVVATTVGALLDTVVHDVTGYLISPDDPKALATAVSTLLRHSFLRRSLGAAGRDRITARYTWDRIALDTVRLYAKSMSTCGGGPTAASV